MKFLVGGTLSLLVTPFLLAARSVEPAERFELTLQRTANGWKAQCDTGCAWKELSVACADDCRVFIDATGVTTSVRDPKTESAFGFVVSRAEKGWQAESVVGTAWVKVGWHCLTGRCHVKIDDSGVTSL